MNAKLAVAISLGASSLALFGMANVANAATATTTDTGANQPAVQQGESATDKAKKEADKVINDANAEKEKAEKEVNEAQGAADKAKGGSRYS